MIRLIYTLFVLSFCLTANAEMFSENFENNWANGSNGNLGGSGAILNSWIIRGASDYKIESDSTNYIHKFNSTSYTSTIAGKAHGLDISNNTAIEISFRLAASGNTGGSFTQGFVWLSDANQNGYGINTVRFNYNQACIFKVSGGTTPFGNTTTATVQQDNPVLGTTVKVGIQNNDWIEYHLRLEQASPGEPIKLIMWQTGSNVADTSYLYAAQTKFDNGNGTASFTGPLINIRNLTYVGFTAVPESSSYYVKIDDIEVDSSVSMPVPMLNGVITVKPQNPYSASGQDDLERLRKLYDSADSWWGLDDKEYNWVKQVGVKGFRACNITRNSYMNGSNFVPGNLAFMLWSAQRRHLNPHIVVAQEAPANLPSNAGDWSSSDWDNYYIYAYNVIKYAAKFKGDITWPEGFDEILFEVENEPDGGGVYSYWWVNGTYPQGSPVFYNALFNIYKVWARAVQQVSTENPDKMLKIGGFGSTNTTWDPNYFPVNWELQLARDAGRDNIRLDFLGIHFYNGLVGKRDSDGVWPYQHAVMRQVLNESGFPNAEIMCTEWGPDGFGSSVNVNQLSASWTAGFLSEWCEYVEDGAALTFLQPNNSWIWPGFVTSRAEYPTAQFNVFKIFSMLPGHRVEVSETDLPPSLSGAFAASDGNSIGVVVYNYIGWSPIDLSDLSKTESVQIRVEDVPFTGQAAIEQYIVDSNHGNIYTQYVMPGELPILDNLKLQRLSLSIADVDNGIITLPRTTLAKSAVSLWMISKYDSISPSPSQMTWEVEPYATGSTSIKMIATTAADENRVEYYFECLTSGGHSSGWQDSPIYEDKGLVPYTNYTYRVKARDKSAHQNETTWSISKSKPTLNYAPWPNPPLFAQSPTALGLTSIKMSAVPASNPYFQEDFESNAWANNAEGNLGLGGGNNGWLCRGPAMNSYSLATEGTNKYLNLPTTTPITWITTGKKHDLDLRNITAIELSFKVRTFSGNNTQPVVWLSDANQNGYGVYMMYNYGSIIKYSGCNVQFGAVSAYNSANGLTNWTCPTTGEDQSNKILLGNNYNGWIKVNIRLEQSAPGQQIKMTMWQTGSNIADRSYNSPAQIKYDNGSGSGPFSAGLINLEKLKLIGFSSGWAGSGILGIDDIRLELLNVASNPEPSEIQYRFECVSGDCHTRDYQSDPTYIDSGLNPAATYSYRVRVRNRVSNKYTMYSEPIIISTNCPADVDTSKTVDFIDFAEFANEYQIGSSFADINQDGQVDLKDVEVFSSFWLWQGN